ncbi:cysteine desulfurase [Paenibacillus oenotherae]|uniref:Cysteine desulfurase n=1 Tax=Paenibacillus oenotherae TaxID=1435645 RepID=A0ABS7D272_9BACL|nr:cysteine desulfurase family protein [Paenibacillus oenotherae]MBW7473682.1 cysteine desulfurase [Paenibacillus oenotherae]
MIYFDHCASTPPHEEVIRTMAEVMAQHYGNPSSLHRGGLEAKKLLQRSRGLVAGLFGTEAEEWVFTSGGTESNNMAIVGAARRSTARGNHLITTEIEHPSVYDTFKVLEKDGFRVTYLPVNAGGFVSLSDVEAALTEDTSLVSIMHVNNEIGSVQPIAAIGELLKTRRSILFHVDGVQSVGKLPIFLREWGVDLFTASAHKVRGPRGAGLLYVRNGLQLEPLMAGGGQENGLRPGTENVGAIVAAAKAFRLAVESQEERSRRMQRLRSRLVSCVQDIPELVLNGWADASGIGGSTEAGSHASHPREEMSPHIVNFSYPGMKPEVFIHMLEKHRILASTKSACSSKDDKPSRVLQAMGASAARAASGIRISFGDEHGDAELEWLCQMLGMVVGKLKPLERKDQRE